MPGNGPFYFARVDADDNEFGHEHLVEDELILRFDRRQEEGGFCRLVLDVVNDRIPPLSKPMWCWFSWDNGTSIEPLFFGRQIAIPSGLQGNIITIEFIARPIDFQSQKEALAQSLRVLPFYDPIFVDPARADDPDVVLEGYSANWHIDPLTHQVTISDTLVGEDGLVLFDEGDAFYDSVQEDIDRAPLLGCTVKASVPWLQSDNFSFSLKPVIMSSSGAGSWPKQGDTIDGGYVVLSASAEETSLPDVQQDYRIEYHNEEKEHDDNDVMSYIFERQRVLGSDDQFPLKTESVIQVADKDSGTPGFHKRGASGIGLKFKSMRGELTLGIDAQNDRMDTVNVTLFSDVQDILRDPLEDSDSGTDVELIELSSNSVSEGDGPAIGQEFRGEYVSTDRGIQTIEHLLMRARARLILGARVARVSWECRLDDALQLSLRKNAKLNDPRISGGEAIGKVTSLSMRGDGATGAFRAGVTIACAVGRGDPIETATGTPDYVDEGYVEVGYQTYTGTILASGTGDFGYSPPFFVATNGDGLYFPLTKRDLVIREEVIEEPAEIDIDARPAPDQGTPATQMEGMLKAVEDSARMLAERLTQGKVRYEVELRDLTKDSFETVWAVNTEKLSIPKQIDYETLSAS